MPRIVFLGDAVSYAGPGGAGPYAALVIAAYADGSADLRVFNGYCEATTDVQKAPQSDDATPGTFWYTKGAKGAGRLAQPLNDSTDTTVALENGSDVAASGDNLLIDDEYMTVTSVINANNLAVARAQGGSSIAAHDPPAVVKIGVALPS
jgi:hypothetical protein